MDPKIKAQARPIEDFEELGSFVMFGMAKSIKRGNGWSRIELVDESGSVGLFDIEQTKIETNKMYFVLVGDNRISRYIEVDKISIDSDDMFVKYLYSEAYPLDEKQKIVISYTPYKTKAGKTMAHLVMSDKDKNLNRAIVFSSMYPLSLAKMREGMICEPILKTLEDGTLMVKEVK